MSVLIFATAIMVIFCGMILYAVKTLDSITDKAQ